ncbi:MAG TPA: WYL domain-containing protein [Gemmatimonadaceae bacterium]|nr:WYL domain-containing protein [Gemmatimonadaceae bacterium]
MIDGAAAQLRRVLALVPELADDEEHDLGELARRLGTDRATLVGDLQSLTNRFDDPAGFVDEGVALFIEAERVSLTSPHFRRPMRLTLAELHALELGLAMLEGERAPEERRAIARARERLRAVTARLPREGEGASRHGELATAAAVAELRTLRQALRARRKVRLRYRKAGESACTERVVCPYALVVASGAWYVVAFCERSDGLRVFRVDRVVHTDLLEARYDEPRELALDALLHDGRVFHADVPRTMTVRYSARIARWIAEREGRTPDADGSLTVAHPLADDEWAVRHVLQYGADAEVLAPAEVRALVARRLAEMAATATG